MEEMKNYVNTASSDTLDDRKQELRSIRIRISWFDYMDE